MNKFLTRLGGVSIVASLLSMPSLASAVGVAFLAPGWAATDFLTLGTPTRAIEF